MRVRWVPLAADARPASVTRPEFCTLSVQPMWWSSLIVEQAVPGYPSVVAEA